jgi:hypothetical protein
MNLNFQEMDPFQKILTKLDKSVLNSDQIWDLLDIQDELVDFAKKAATTQDEIFKSYKLEPVEGKYDWREHPNSAEITNKIQDLYSKTLELTKSQIFSKEDLLAAGKSCDLSELAFLRKCMVK